MGSTAWPKITGVRTIRAVTDEIIDNNVGVILPLKAIATEKGISPSQLTLAWLLH